MNKRDQKQAPTEQRVSVMMEARMMWGVKRGVSLKDTETLRAIRDLPRKQRRALLSRAGRRARKVA